MNFGTRSRAREAGKALGFFLGYELFFSMLYLVAVITEKLPFAIGFGTYIMVMTGLFIAGKGVLLGVRHARR